MSDLVLIGLIAAIPPTITAIAVLVVSLKSNKQIEEVHLSINSRMDELLKSTKSEATAAGKELGRKERG